MSKRLQEPWMTHVKVGDVLRSCTGTLRVVREVSRYKNGDLSAVTFAIRHCSWTRRPYTTMNYTDLRMQGFTRVGANYSLKTELDARLARDIADHHRRDVTCCEVRGIA